MPPTQGIIIQKKVNATFLNETAGGGGGPRRTVISQMTSIIRVANINGTLCAWRVPATATTISAAHQQFRSINSRSSAGIISRARGLKGFRKQKGKYLHINSKRRVIAVGRVQPSILRRDLLQKKNHGTRRLKVLELFRFAGNRVTRGEANNSVVPTKAYSLMSWINTSKTSALPPREYDPTLPIIPDPNEDYRKTLEDSISGSKVQDTPNLGEESQWYSSSFDKNGHWVMDSICGLCGRPNHFNHPNILAVDTFHPNETCICCGLFHVEVDPCNGGVPVEPITNPDILL